MNRLKYAAAVASAVLLLSVVTVPGEARAESVALPYMLKDATSFYTGTKIYIVGGFAVFDFGIVLDSILSYSPSTGKIVQESAHLQSVVRSATSFWDGKSAYIFGGLALNDSDPLDDLHVFTPPGNVQTFKHFLPYGMKGNSIVLAGKYAYLFGNCITKSSCGQKNITRFEPKMMNLTVLNNSLPLNIAGTSTVWTGSDIYLFGGMTANDPTDMIIKFNPSAGNCTVMKGKLPFARYHTGAVWYNGKALIFGGQMKNGSYVDQIVIYDPAGDKVSVSNLKLPYPLATRSYALVKDKIYLCGGSTREGPMASIEILSAQDILSIGPPQETDIQTVMTVSAAFWVMVGLAVTELYIIGFGRKQRKKNNK